jgi:hypothetical protein
MSTKSRWRNGILEFYDSVTHETTPVGAPFYYKDDFLGAGGLAAIPATSSEERGVDWVKLIVGSGPPVAQEAADGSSGVMSLALTATSEAQDCTLSWGDQLGFDVTNGGQVEFKARFTAVPTTGTRVVAGICGPHNLAKDTVANSAWFSWDGTAITYAETDDTTNNNDDKATGITAVVDIWEIYRIDFTDLTDVLFYIDGVSVATATTFDMSNLTAAEKIMQPYFSLDKASGTSVGTLEIDYIKLWGKRI